MKKLSYLFISTLAVAVVLMSSCKGSVSTNPTLKTDNDTLAYAFGVNLYETGLDMYLQQLGIYTDTAQIRQQFSNLILNAENEIKKDSLEKVMRSQIDSTESVNRKNIADFMRGLQKGISATKSENAYLQGIAIGNQISGQIVPNFKGQIFGEEADKEQFNSELIASGIGVSILKLKSAVSDPASYIKQRSDKSRQEQEEARLAKQEKSKVEQDAKSKAFFDENTAKEGVVSLPSGLQYKIITEGKGDKPKATDRVTVAYIGKDLDGNIFDQNENATFGVTQVIKGWTEALQLMPVGSKWELYIPSDLAYGERATGSIKPYSTLTFVVELKSIAK